MSRSLRIGTRDSKLAVWQAEQVAGSLERLGRKSELVHVKSEGDLDLVTPLSAMGGKGVFTKALDEALLRKEIDLAVHSYKDLPTEQTLPLGVAAVLRRGDARDVLVAPSGTGFLSLEGGSAVIATGSNRRKAQWLNRYPRHRVTGLRGNVQTRLQKVETEGWDGAIFAGAGLQRAGLEERISLWLDWMIPAPAQGAIAVMIRREDRELERELAPLNHRETVLCTAVERELLARMEAGCSAPLGAFARLENDVVSLRAVVLRHDGSLRYDVQMSAGISEATGLGGRAAEELLERGAGEIVTESE